jgi:hypothetical protein
MAGESPVQEFADIAPLLSAIIGYLSRDEAAESQRRSEMMRRRHAAVLANDDAAYRAAEALFPLADQCQLDMLNALRTCCEAALRCSDQDTVAARPAVRQAVDAVELWYELEKRKHEFIKQEQAKARKNAKARAEA